MNSIGARLGLGLIPIHRLKELPASSFGKIGFRSNLGPELLSRKGHFMRGSMFWLRENRLWGS